MKTGSSQRDQQGIVLIHAMILVAVIAVLAAAAIQRGSGLALDNLRERARIRALYAAEGGLAHARYRLRRDPAFAGGSLAIGGCAVEVAVRRLRAGQWELRARARCPTRGRAAVVVDLREGFGAERWFRESR